MELCSKEMLSAIYRDCIGTNFLKVTVIMIYFEKAIPGLFTRI